MSISDGDFLDLLDEEVSPGEPADLGITIDLGEQNDPAGMDVPDESDVPTTPDEPDVPEALPDPEGVVRQQCEQWLQTAATLRFGYSAPGAQASPTQIKDCLVEVRARLDQLELVLASVMAFKAATVAKAVELEKAADDAWEDRAGTERRTARREWEGPRERYAYWELDIRPQRHAARLARARADYAKEACECIELHYYGLDGVRRDLAGRLTHLRWESSMEQ